MSDEYNPYKAPESDLTKPAATVPEGEKYTPVMVEHLKNTRPWVLFVSILNMIMMAFMIMGGMGMMMSGVMIGSTLDGTSAFGGGSSIILIGLVYIAVAGIYLPYAIFLFRYARSIRNLLKTGKTESIEKALGYQKSYWKYSGILAIVLMALALIFVVFFMVFTIMNVRSFL